MPKRYDYFDHKADVGIIGIGTTLPEAFEQAAKAIRLISTIIQLSFRPELGRRLTTKSAVFAEIVQQTHR